MRPCLFVLAALAPAATAHAQEAPHYQLAGARPGVVVMADLAHRTRNGDLAEAPLLILLRDDAPGAYMIVQARFDCVNSTRQYLRYDFYSSGLRQPMQASDPESSRVASGTTDHKVLDLICAAEAPAGPIFTEAQAALVYARSQMPSPAAASR